MRAFLMLLCCGLLAGCAFSPRGEPVVTAFPTRFDTPAAPTGEVAYHRDIAPILNRRCVACHACYDAPCQLKLGSWDGVARGATQAPVYDGFRTARAPTTRLFVDAQKASDWRTRGFFPIIDEQNESRDMARLASLLTRMLALKREHPTPAATNGRYALDFALERKQVCPRQEDFELYALNAPEGGMPFGLPALSDRERATIVRWVEQGAPVEAVPAPPARVSREVAEWDRFFNQDLPRAQLAARYMYEHLYLAHLYFEGDEGRFFRLVRSRTPPGEAVEEIATRRPFDDPHVARVYYRLRPVTEAIAAKSHMPYLLNANRMARWRELLMSGPPLAAGLPGYKVDQAANPFETFRELPMVGRYRFMLEESQFTVMGFIKGPVCRGQTALNVIEDHFWVFFADPDRMTAADEAFINSAGSRLEFPAEQDRKRTFFRIWDHRDQENAYLAAKANYLERRFAGGGMNANTLWNGGGRNPNAALTIYRHFDSATVLQGLEGEAPKTAWVLNYPLLERIHYLLVAGFDVYGNIVHQLDTRIYMDFLRMEGEHNFIALLPKAKRTAVRDLWYFKADEKVKERVYGKVAHFDVESEIALPETDAPAQALMRVLAQRVAAALPPARAPAGERDARLRTPLTALGEIRGKALDALPEASLLRVRMPGGGTRTYTLLRNTGHFNVTHLLREDRELAPEQHSLDVLSGVAAPYPNAIFRVELGDLPAFADAVRGLDSKDSFETLFARYGLSRTAADFWAESDALHEDYARSEPVSHGVLDYNRLGAQ